MILSSIKARRFTRKKEDCSDTILINAIAQCSSFQFMKNVPENQEDPSLSTISCLHWRQFLCIMMQAIHCATRVDKLLINI